MYAKPLVNKLDLAVERALCCHANATIAPRLDSTSETSAKIEPITVAVNTGMCPFPVFSDNSVSVAIVNVGSISVSGN